MIAAAASAARGATLRAVLLVLVGAIAVQGSAALMLGLFGRIGVLPSSALRLLLAAAFLCLLFRPRVRGRPPREWAAIALYGAAMAAMSQFFFLSIDRIPLGIATTIDFLGPCLVALGASRGVREGLLAVVAFLGVALIAGFGGPLDPLGIVFAAAAGVCFGAYTVLAARIGKSASGLSSVALSVAVAAVLTLPFSLPAIPRVDARSWGILALAALLGTALAFLLDSAAARLTSARVIGVLFAFDPVVGTLVGMIWLAQPLSLPAALGVLLVVSAGAGIVWLAGSGRGAGRAGAEP